MSFLKSKTDIETLNIIFISAWQWRSQYGAIVPLGTPMATFVIHPDQMIFSAGVW
jgi:hypothetical protein